METSHLNTMKILEEKLGGKSTSKVSAPTETPPKPYQPLVSKSVVADDNGYARTIVKGMQICFCGSLLT